MTKMTKAKKIFRIIKRRWLKPFMYAILMSMLLYIIIGDVVVRKYSFSSTSPHFVISRVDDKFDETEFMHLLLTIQEINKTVLKHDLRKFVNEPYSAKCPKYLRLQLYNMNWEPEAFYVRVKKLFEMYEIYDQIARLDATINLFKEEIVNSNIASMLYQQISSLEQEKSRIIEGSLSNEEFEFIKEYGGVVPSLQILEEK